MDNSAKFGIGLWLIGSFSPIIVGVLPMTMDWTIPPTIAKIVVIGSIIFMVIGLGFIISSFKKSSTKIKEQNATIKEQEDRLSRLRRKHTNFDEIPNIVDKMNKRLNDFVESKANENISSDLLLDIFFNWSVKVVHYLRPISGKPSNFDLIICTLLMSFRIRRIGKADDKAVADIQWLNGEMDEKNVGLKQVTETDEYKKLADRLADIRNNIGNEILNKAIEKYMLYSYSVNSFILFYAYALRHDFIRIPMLRIPISQVSNAFNIKMNVLRTGIVKYVELSLIGK